MQQPAGGDKWWVTPEQNLRSGAVFAREATQKAWEGDWQASAWIEQQVAAARRGGVTQRHRSTQMERRQPPHDFKLFVADDKDVLEHTVRQWEAYNSKDLWEHPKQAVEKAARRNIECMKLLQGSGGQHSWWKLISHLPEDPGCKDKVYESDSDKFGLILDLVKRHRGEIREIIGSGTWVEYAGPCPTPVTAPDMCHPQFMLTKELARSLMHCGRNPNGTSTASCESGDQQSGVVLASTIYMHGPGEPGEPQAHFRRHAEVFGLGDLFAKFGDSATAHDLYGYYLCCRVIVCKREHGASNTIRCDAARGRFAKTGFYGWGKQHNEYSSSGQDVGGANGWPLAVVK
jgi:hypothetical protein